MDEDQILVSRFQQGDRSAFDALFRRYKDQIYGLVYRIVGPDAADDVVQDVFIQICKSLRGFRGDASFRTWAYKIALNACRGCIRRKVRQSAHVSAAEVDCLESIPDPSSDVATLWTRDELERAVRELPERERTAVELHYVQRLSYSETAAVLGCPSTTVKSRIRNAVTKLRRSLHHLAEEVG